MTMFITNDDYAFNVHHIAFVSPVRQDGDEWYYIIHLINDKWHTCIFDLDSVAKANRSNLISHMSNQ